MTITRLKSTFTGRNFLTHKNEMHNGSTQPLRWPPVTLLPGTHVSFPQVRAGPRFRYKQTVVSILDVHPLLSLASLVLGKQAAVYKGPCGVTRKPQSSSPGGTESCQQPPECTWVLVPSRSLGSLQMRPHLCLQLACNLMKALSQRYQSLALRSLTHRNQKIINIWSVLDCKVLE